MSKGASTYSHVNKSPITAEIHDGVSLRQVRRPGTVAEAASFPPEIETQLVVDRLLRECFTRKPPRTTGRIDAP